MKSCKPSTSPFIAEKKPSANPLLSVSTMDDMSFASCLDCCTMRGQIMLGRFIKCVLSENVPFLQPVHAFDFERVVERSFNVMTC